MVEEIKALSEQHTDNKERNEEGKEPMDFFSGLARSSSDSGSEDSVLLMQVKEEQPMPTPAQVCEYFDQQLTTGKMTPIFAACADLSTHEAMTELLNAALYEINTSRFSKKKAALELMAGIGRNRKTLEKFYE